MGVHRLASLLVLLGTVGYATIVQAQVTHNSITLNWTTPGDDAMAGTASEFDLRYSTSPISAGNFNSATRWTAMPSPGTPGVQQSVNVTGLQSSTTYWFAIKTADEVPNWSGISNVFSRATLDAPDVVRPGPVASLAVSGITDTSATLNWTAVGDDSLTGTANSYDIRYATSPINDTNWSSATKVTGEPAPTAPGTSQNYTVNGLSRQVTYYFALKVADDAGNQSALSNVPNATTPDTMPPGTILDLGVSAVPFSAASASAVRVRNVEAPRL